ncbi:acetyl-CoA carboxylase biotin carboxyl carrier protein [Desemzia incerta]|uniref:acetyl-CoA carboxylase biotin carboxyl carrier protein n=1 Tax=Desemzia incerta TaxID=82801 RepID=UPI003CFBFBCD
MDFNQVKELIHLIDQSSLKEFHLQMDNVNVQMSKNSHAPAAQPAVAEPKSEWTQSAPSVNISSSIESSETSALSSSSNAQPEVTAGEAVLSPIVGVVYLSPEPGKPNFKKVGDTVQIGETLCIVEAMKVMNEIKSEVDGTITEIMVEDSQVVEYNQPLFKIG